MSAGAITAGGCLGILIPPSVLLIVYGATAGVSVVQLYAGAFFPGIMLAALYIGYVIVLAKLQARARCRRCRQSERHVALPPFAQTLAHDAAATRCRAVARADGARDAGVPKRHGARAAGHHAAAGAVRRSRCWASTWRLATAPTWSSDTGAAWSKPAAR